MKKTLSVAAFGAATVLAASVVPTNDAQAIPSFARQVGMGCLACHFQTFPALNAFGRAFKMNAFTDGGGPIEDVEDEHLNIPGALNASFVVRANYTVGSNAAAGNENGGIEIPVDTVLLLGGRIGAHTGTFIEFDGTAANWQLLNSIDFGAVKGGVNFFNTGFGPTAGIETSNVFGQHAGSLAGGDVSPTNTLTKKAYGGNEQGVAFWAGNNDFIAQLALIAPGEAVDNIGTKLGNAGTVGKGAGLFNLATLVRVFATPQIGDLDVGVGFGVISGKAHKDAKVPMDAMWVDAQVQTEVSGMQVGVYGDYASVKGKTNTGASLVGGTLNNPFGTSGTGLADGDKQSGFGFRATAKVMPAIIVGAGYMSMKSDIAGATTTDTTTHLAVTWEIYQNMELNVVYNAYNNGNGNTTLLDLEALM